VLASDRHEYTVGERVTLRITLSNNSAESWRRIETSHDRDFEAHVTTENGDAAQLTEHGAKIRRMPYGLGFAHLVNLVPGGKMTAEQDLTAIYSLTTPGKYGVIVVLSAMEGVRSNRIEVILKPALK
jgi:hypothetical protein